MGKSSPCPFTCPANKKTLHHMDNRARGRGAGINTDNKFRKQEIEYTSEDWMQWEEPATNPKTLFIEEISKSILSKSDSPDLRHFNSINP